MIAPSEPLVVADPAPPALPATAGVTGRKDLARTVETLASVQAKLVGAVLNGTSGDGAYYYRYGYGHEGTPTR